MKTRPLKIVGLGDSTTAGTPGFLSPLEAPPSGRGNPESQYVFWMMRLHPNWIVFNCGINGEETDEILHRLPQDVLQRKPDYAIILAGVNDIYRGREVEAVKSNLTAMYRETATSGIRVVAATILPFDSMSQRQAEAIRELNQWIKTAATISGQLFCDTHELVSDPEDRNRLVSSPDGLHPDVFGYRKMGEGIVRVIEEAETKGAVK